MKNALRALAVLFVGILFLCGGAFAQAPDPVQWTLTLKPDAVKPGGKTLATLTATIQPGWHLYSLTTPKGGPNPTSATLADNAAISGIKIYEPAPARKFDESFKIDTETYEKEVAFLVEVTAKPGAPAGPTDLEMQVRYQACQNTLCLPPKRKSAKATLKIDAAAKTVASKIPAGYTEAPQH